MHSCGVEVGEDKTGGVVGGKDVAVKECVVVSEANQTIRSRMVLVMACATVCATACVAVVDESVQQRDIDVNVERSPLGVSAVYSVSSGQNPVAMTPVASSVCFLVGISGGFDNVNGLSVVQTRAQIGGTAKWYLESNSEGDRNAAAKCLYGVSASQRTGPHTWSQGASALDIGSSSDRICMLTGVQGKFNGNGEQARTRISGGRWILDGTSGTNENYMISAQAYCVLGVGSTERSGEYSVVSLVNGTGWVYTPYQAGWGNSNPDFCALTRVQGKFNSPTAAVFNDSVFVSDYGNGPYTNFELRAIGDSSTVRGGARCIDKDAL